MIVWIRKGSRFGAEDTTDPIMSLSRDFPPIGRSSLSKLKAEIETLEPTRPNRRESRRHRERRILTHLMIYGAAKVPIMMMTNRHDFTAPDCRPLFKSKQQINKVKSN